MMGFSTNAITFIAVVASFALIVSATPVSLTTSERLTTTQYASLRKRWCEEAQQTLICNFIPTVNSSVRGMVLFKPKFSDGICGVMISARIYGLVPGKKSAIHIHTWGDISLANGKSAGGHFTNPGLSNVSHGMPGDKTRHWGDFGSLSPAANDNGMAEYERLDKRITILGIVGRGMIIHRDEDKGVEAQPSGGAGPRKAMCVIGFANPATQLE